MHLKNMKYTNGTLFVIQTFSDFVMNIIIANWVAGQFTSLKPTLIIVWLFITIDWSRKQQLCAHFSSNFEKRGSNNTHK